MKLLCKHIPRIVWLGVLAALAVYTGGGEILTQRRRVSEYDAKGRLIKIKETGKPTEYRHYNNFSECTNTTLIGQAPRACRQRIRENDTRYGFNAHFRAENIKEGCELELVHK